MALNMKVLKGNYLVAGSTGLMGTTALLRLRNLEGVTIRAAYRNRQPHIFADNISYLQADLTNPDDCHKAVEGIDYVLMFAAVLSTAPVVAKNPVSHITSNMIMNAQMLEASYLAKVKKFLWLSSSTGYPTTDRVLNESNMFDADPVDKYFPVGWMSRYTEILCRMYSTKLKNPLLTIILRPTTIYGEYEDFDLNRCHVLPALVRKVVERHKPLEVWGTGQNMRDLIYSDDLFDACLLALEKINSFDVFNIGFGKQHSVNEILDLIIEIDGYFGAEIVFDKSKPMAIEKMMLDFSKSDEKLGFKAKTSLKDGITKMVHWYRSNPANN